MEPMTLGSAPSSPASPNINPNFLPSFLMGDTKQPSSPIPSTSPGRNRTSGNFPKLDSRNLRQKLFNQSITESPISAPPSPFIALSEKAGPPRQGLFDSIEKPKVAASPLSSTVAGHFCNESAIFTESISRINDDSLNYTRDATVGRSNVSQRFDRIDTHWVTVFGFPPSALTLVLAQLSNCGSIVDKIVPSSGNWVHVKFHNLNEVARALAMNGRCISNAYMIGVMLHYGKDHNKENDASVYTSPVRARSLRHSFVSPHKPSSVLPSQALPQKSSGLVTKAMEYVFGW